MEPQASPNVQFTTNGFVGNPYLIIFLGFFSGMTLMFFGIMLGGPVFISMLLLLGGIGLAFGYGIGKVTYTLTNKGITQKIRRFISLGLKQKEKIRNIPWKNITSYKNDTDKKRYSGEYEYLKLYLNISPGEVWMTNEHDDPGFRKFKEAFLQKVKTIHSPSVETIIHPLPSANIVTSEPEGKEDKGIGKPSIGTPLQIKERKSFYKTFFAKLITVLFVFITIILIWVLSFKGMHVTNWFKLLYIILPGTVYMVYRVYFSPGIE
jgi:hypothetical protein